MPPFFGEINADDADCHIDDRIVPSLLCEIVDALRNPTSPCAPNLVACFTAQCSMFAKASSEAFVARLCLKVGSVLSLPNCTECFPAAA
jgi:hypothetical protein